MPVVDLKTVDEVWLAMEQTFQTLSKDGHSPSEIAETCGICFCMGLLRRGMDAYLERVAPCNVPIPTETG